MRETCIWLTPICSPISHPRCQICAAGSRYAPVAPLAAIAAELDAGGRFAFVGKPCDVSALRQWAKHDPRIDVQVVVMLSFFCAGTPSQAGTDRIIKRLGANPDRLASFRYRGDGWPGYATAVEADGRTTRMSYAASWGEILSREVQYRCKICPDAVGGVADIAAADAWYGDEGGYPSFDEQEGRSLIVARTEAPPAATRRMTHGGGGVDAGGTFPPTLKAHR